MIFFTSDTHYGHANVINVGVDVRGFTPRTLAELLA